MKRGADENPDGPAGPRKPPGLAGRPPQVPETFAMNYNSPLDKQTKDDDDGSIDSQSANEGKLMKRMGEVIITMNKQITILTERLEAMDEERKKKNDPDKLAAINQKDITKPNKYSGTGWVNWSKIFTSFLERRDRRWKKLLDKISARSAGPPLTDDAKRCIATDADIWNKGTLQTDFTEQLYDYLQEFTAGEILTTVIAGGRMGSWETWRYLSESGKSRQKTCLKEDYKRLMHPKQVELETLIKSIHAWEAEVAEHVRNGGKSIEGEERVMCIEEMCPAPLQEYLSEKAEEDKISEYSEYKTVISSYVTRKLRSSKKSLRSVAGPRADPIEEEQTEKPSEEELDLNWKEMERLCSVCGLGELNALVKDKFGKKGKGKGKGGHASASGPAPMEVDHSGKECYRCGELGHIAANCPQNAQAPQPVGPGGFNKGGKSKGFKGSKGGHKGDGKAGKGGGGKNGIYFPTYPQWQHMYPGPSQQQWKSWWQQAQGNGKVNLFEAPHQLSQFQHHWPADEQANQSDATGAQLKSTLGALFSAGNVYKLVHKGNKPKNVPPKEVNFEHANKFDAISDENAAKSKAQDIKIQVNLMDAIKPTSKNKLRRATPKRENGSSASNARATFPEISSSTSSARATFRTPTVTSNSLNMLDEMKDLIDLTRKGVDIVNDKVPTHCLNVLKAKPASQTLCPATSQPPSAAAGKRGKWETLSAIVDSGASITAVNPATGKQYEVQESEASKKGDEVEIANGDTMPLLGKKMMAVMTKEGTLRGFESHVVDVSGPLESVRQLLGSKHCVLFGLGPNEEHHLIINKISGEVNMMRDDGVNYLHDMLIVPPDEINDVHQALQSSQPFGWQA